MQIIENLDNIPEIENAVVTSGTFDGVHFGHKRILERLIKKARQIKGKSVVLTFWPHPRLVLCPDQTDLKLLSTFDEKAGYMKKIGIDYLIKIQFTPEFSQLSSEDFIRSVIVDKIKTQKLIIGYDHKFGKNREGSFEYLRDNSEQFGFQVEEIASQDIDDVAVSSTKIRKALDHGDVELAATFLEKNYSLQGFVIRGNKLGSELGFPTANIELNEASKLVPKDGVYVVRVFLLGQTFGGMLNIGSRPTIENAGRSVEVHVFGLSAEVYGESIGVEFIKRIRDEHKFESLDELKIQLESDKSTSMKILKNQSK